MIDPEHERWEEGLQRISPAPAPEDLMQRLRRVAVEAPPARRAEPRPTFRWSSWLAGWRGLAVAGSAAAVILLVWLAPGPAVAPGKTLPARTLAAKNNAVQVGHSLLASFDGVAQLPGSEPVRFRYREWQDEVVIHDAAHGVVISQITPRVEVVPVRFETY